MSIERRNPLPKGVYWVDVFGEDVRPFIEWTKQGAVRVRKTREYSDPSGYWFLFETTEPTAWKGPGFPTVAEHGAKTVYEDTSTADEAISAVKKRSAGWGVKLFWGGLGLGALYILVNRRQ